ncbi:D-Ala-D-Ala carboxypeptidase family metallohydrolase [Mesorhizobium sp. A556]
MAEIARDLVGTILGEAGGKTTAQRYQDMLGIASVVANRAAATRKSVQDVISAPNQFSAYGKALPAGVEKFDALARMAIDQVSAWGPVNNATYYATPAAVSNLPSNLLSEDETVAHQYFSDPKNRSIRTATGYVTPDPEAMAMGYAPTPDVSAASAATAAMASADPGTIAGFSRAGLTPGIDRVADAISAVNPGLGINSGYRSPSRNAAAGGAKHSQHMLGNALDVDISGLNDTQKATALNAALEAGAKGIGLYSSGNVMHVDARENPAVWGMMPGASYKGMPVSMAPGWAQPGLQDMFDAGQFDVTPRNTPPTPTQRPAPETAVAQAAAMSFTGPEAQSVRTTSVPGTPTTAPDTTGLGFFAGKPGAMAGVPAQSVQSVSYTPDMAMADAAPATPTPDEAFSGTTQSPSSRALAEMAKADDQSISEIAGTQVGAVAPSNAYATTNLPDFAPSVNPALQAAVAPVTVTPQPAVRPPAVPTPKVTAPTITAPQTRAPAQSMPSGVQAAMDFHAGINNAAMASNGNTLTRDALGNSYNYSPSFDVTTISDPTGRTVGVKQGKVSPDMAGPSAAAASTSTPSASKGLFSGIGDTLGGIFSGDNVSNAVVGGLGGLGGAAVGSLLGPVGSMVGSAIGRSLAVQHNPFASNPAAIQAQNLGLAGIGGLGGLGGGGFDGSLGGIHDAFGSLADAIGGGMQSNRSTGGMGGISPGAANAIGKGGGGLY